MGKRECGLRALALLDSAEVDGRNEDERYFE